MLDDSFDYTGECPDCGEEHGRLSACSGYYEDDEFYDTRGLRRDDYGRAI